MAGELRVSGDGTGRGVTVLQLSDTHLTRTPGRLIEGRDPDARLAAVLDAWGRSGHVADLVLLTGDNADDGSVEAYRRLRVALEPLGLPVLAIPGNHDDAGNQRVVFGDATVAEVGAWRLVGVSSAVPHQVHGTVDVASVARRLDELDERPTVVAIHHPPVSRSAHEWFRLDGAQALLTAMAERPHVRMPVSGHVHDVFDLPGPGDLELVGCPSALMAIVHDGDRFSFAEHATTAARVLHLADDGSWSAQVMGA